MAARLEGVMEACCSQMTQTGTGRVMHRGGGGGWSLSTIVVVDVLVVVLPLHSRLAPA